MSLTDHDLAAASAHPLRNGRLTVALFSGAMSTRYRNEIVFGASECALERGYNILNFIAGVPHDPLEHVRAKLFDYLDPGLFDALVLPLSTVGGRMSDAQLASFLAPYRHMPVACIGSSFEGASSVLTDNVIGMRQLMQHLIEDHGYRKIAFVCGTDHKLSTLEKLDTYRQMLTHYGIEPDPRYVIKGPLERLAPDWFARIFIDERRLDAEAIVSVNDNQAFSIIHSLTERGLRVPQDIAVTGCMNIVEGSVFVPSLTTVQEPMRQLGWLAANAVIDQLEGASRAVKIVAPSELVTRHSCGCSSAQIEARRQSRAAALQVTTESTAADGMTALCALMHAAAQGAMQSLRAPIDEQELRDIARQFAAVTNPADIGQALLALEAVIDRHLRDSVVTAWLSVIPAVHEYMRDTLAGSHGTEAIAAMSARFEALASAASLKAFNYCSLVSESYIRAFRQMSLELNQRFNLESVRRLVVRELGAQDCYISVFSDSAENSSLCRNLLAIGHRQLLALPEAQASFEASSLLPPCLPTYQQPYALLTFPLTFGEELLGLMTVNFFDRKGAVYENLVELTSSALKNERQIAALTRAEQKFTSIALSASDWLWEVDADARYVFCSDGVEAVLGYRASEMIGRSLFEFVAERDAAYVEHVRTQLMPAGLALDNLPHTCVHKCGEEVSVSISGRPIIQNEVVVGYRGAFKDTSQDTAHEQRIRQLAYNDPLTGLPNRALFQDRLNQMIAMAQRRPRPFALLFLDLDRFKHVNDTLGHGAGDELLRQVAERLSGCIGNGDTLARLGGDEFTMIIAGAANHGALAGVAQKIIDVICAPFEILGKRLFVTTSLGIASFPQDGESAALLLKNADKAMYKAKELGANQFVFYDKQMGDASRRRMQVEVALRKALRDSTFHLHYQPQVAARSGRVVGTEALVRLIDAELGFISPAEFVPLAEEVGLIEALGAWVFETACKQARLWSEAGYNQRVAVNVSAWQLKNSALADTFIDIAERVGVSPRLIEVEITESAMIDNEITARDILNTLSTFGFQIALDDFGTGYSSLSSLKKFPIDTLKIDRAFINDCTGNDDAATLVSAIIQISKSLGLNIIAEGVETREQLALLRDWGCDEIQGYLFSKPMPPEQLDDVLRAGLITLPALVEEAD